MKALMKALFWLAFLAAAVAGFYWLGNEYQRHNELIEEQQRTQETAHPAVKEGLFGHRPHK
jgi:hypothetical protein